MIASGTFSTRLEDALDYAGIPSGRDRRRYVAKKFGVSYETARKWLAGEMIPKTSRIQEISKALGVQGEWLLTGQGIMRPGMLDAIGESPPMYASKTRKIAHWAKVAEGLTEAQIEDAIRRAQDDERHNKEVIAQLATRPEPPNGEGVGKEKAA